MTTPTGSDDIRDDRVSRAYRDLAVEKTPAALDRAVLAAAGRRARSGRANGWRGAWYRPVGLVATVGLCLALILELSRTDLTGTPPVGDARRLPADAFEAAGNRTAAEIERIGTGLSTSMPPAGAEPAPADSPAESTRLPVEDHCSEEDRATASTWWTCIEDLEKRGLTAAAERELQALLEAYPGFPVPQ